MLDDHTSSDAENGEEELYEVERVLAQDVLDGQMLFLVKWRGYSDEQCTWEPAENFSNPDTLQEWKDRLAIGDTLDEDGVAAVQARMNAYNDAQDENREQRSLKRRKLAKEALHREFCSSESDTPMIIKRSKVKSTSTSRSASSTRAPPPKSLFATASLPNTAQPISKRQPANLPRAGASFTSSTSTAFARSSQIGPSGHTTSTTEPQPKVAASKPLVLPNETQRSSAQVTGDKPGTVKRSSAMDPGRNAQSRVGEKFRNLSHQNNYAKSSRREGDPDMTRLDLKTPEEWSKKAMPAPIRSSSKDIANESWLFVPEGETSESRPLESAQNERTPSSSNLTMSQSEQRLSMGARSTSQSGHKPAPPDRRSSLDEQKHPPVERRPSLPDRRVSHDSQKDHNQGFDRLSKVQTSQTHAVEPSVSIVLAPTTSRDFQPPFLPSADSSSTVTIPFVQSTNLITTKSGRHFKVGQELLVHLSFGRHTVGDVKILNLPPWLRTKLLVLKAPGDAVLGFRFEQDKVMSSKEWVNFASLNLAGPAVSLGIIEAYQDTMSSVDSLADYLEQQDACAIWIYPDPAETVIMVLFSGEAASWNHLRRNQSEQTESRLCLWVRNTREPLYQGPSQTHHFSLTLSRTSGDASDPGSRHSGALTQNPVETRPKSTQDVVPRNLPTLPSNRQSTIVSEIVNTPLSKFTAATANEVEAEGVQISHSLSEADFAHLTRVSSRFKGDASKPRVFLAFTHSHPYEARVVRSWLGEHMKDCNIYSSAEQDGWEEFLDGGEQKIAVVLFHEKAASYTSLTKLSSRLKLDGFVCFNAVFETGRISFLRLFPRGTTLGITESCMINHPKLTFYALKWFEGNSKGKQTGWKLLLFPNAIGWVMGQLARSSDAETQKRLANILKILLKLSVPTTKSLGGDNTSLDPDQYSGFVAPDGLDDSVVLSPSCLLGYQTVAETKLSPESATRARDKVFSEFFRGWAAMNATNYRRFMILDDVMTNKTEPHACHVKFQHPKQFISDNGLKK